MVANSQQDPDPAHDHAHGHELWGRGAPAQRLTVSINAWEPYMEPA